jgi:hypothetical protein
MKRIPNAAGEDDRASARLLSGAKGVVAIAGGLVTVAAAVTLIVSTARDVGGEKPPSEAERLAQLQGGMAFARFRKLVGAEPSISKRMDKDAPDSKRLRRMNARRYVFVLRSVLVQAVVADGTVVGFAIVSRDGKVRPRFAFPTRREPAVLGRSTFAQYEVDRLGGFCGANRAQYFEAFGGSNADNAQQFAIGVSTVGSDDDRVFDAVCAAAGRLTECGAEKAWANVILAPDAARCFLISDESAQLRQLQINTYVETAPQAPLFSELMAPLEPEIEGISPTP